jgi:hypothetical protein
MDSAVTSIIVDQIPGLVSAHPEVALTAAAVAILLEHIWPLLPVKWNSSGGMIVQALAVVARALLRKRQPPTQE